MSAKPFFNPVRLAGMMVLFIICSTVILLGQQPYSVAEHYNKHEYMIPMRDGVKLYTAVYTPKDTSKDYPILLNRTPYSSGPYGENMFSPFVGSQAEKFYRDGYIMVSQDVRGLYM